MQNALEHDVEEQDLLVVGCGARVRYLNSSIRSARQASVGKSSYVVSTLQHIDYRDRVNGELIESARVEELGFFSYPASDFLEILHREFCGRVLADFESELALRVDRVAQHDAQAGSVLRTELATVKQRLHEVIRAFNLDTSVLQLERMLRRSLLFVGDVSDPSIIQKYIPLRSNRALVLRNCWNA